ncbi:hypothetical protein LTR36_002354 [Oleoguttula mirabilis]|uniref:Ubiquitin-like domain-containing protein n=1 Tax=Oleoguttula mirabilis TaxID=1507867 RepID=A0AAV9JL54_9PEZI|nr:hypothetical protein LTR36_002354 [Oleoguttula mirabilis]
MLLRGRACRALQSPFLRATDSPDARFSGCTLRLSPAASQQTIVPKGEDYQGCVECTRGITEAQGQEVRNRIDQILQSAAPKTAHKAIRESYNLESLSSGYYYTGFGHPKLYHIELPGSNVPASCSISIAGARITAEQKEKVMSAIRQLEEVTNAQIFAPLREELCSMIDAVQAFPYQSTLRAGQGTLLTLAAAPDAPTKSTADGAKKEVASKFQDREGIPPDQMRLIYRGRVIFNGKDVAEMMDKGSIMPRAHTAAELGLRDDAHVHLVIAIRGP